MNITFLPSISNNTPKWYYIDAKGKNLGRLATQVANILRGKNKSTFTPFLDTGDYVIMINSDEVQISGQKELQKVYYSHSGRPGGLKQATFKQLKIDKSNRIIEKAVKGMLPKGPLGRKLFRKLKVYKGSNHPHIAQKPELV
uniref:Large ribosomal subunit protein uL13c n=1 Tax=Corynoplastis japonica TaxID=700918 RepID=A0A1X9PU09_9RHOD|nr:50S ribosomal protein L13 [Corynoplastis japonica]